MAPHPWGRGLGKAPGVWQGKLDSSTWIQPWGWPLCIPKARTAKKKREVQGEECDIKRDRKFSLPKGESKEVKTQVLAQKVQGKGNDA